MISEQKQLQTDTIKSDALSAVSHASGEADQHHRVLNSNRNNCKFVLETKRLDCTVLNTLQRHKLEFGLESENYFLNSLDHASAKFRVSRNIFGENLSNLLSEQKTDLVQAGVNWRLLGRRENGNVIRRCWRISGSAQFRFASHLVSPSEIGSVARGAA